MKTIWICVYRDTIEDHNENQNLAEVEVTKDFAEQYFNEYIKEDDRETFEDFLDQYTADWTEGFYKYAMERNAVIDIKNL